MAEWSSVIAVYWLFWAWDGVRVLPYRVGHAVGGPRRNRGRLAFGRLGLLGVWPGNWWMPSPDVPLSLSPVGLCNRLIGCVGRPAEQPETVHAWRWEEVRQVGVAGGWLYVNDKRFCRDTGHVTGAELLELAGLPAAKRAPRIEDLLARWVRPMHLRRRALALRERTATPASLNLASLILLLAVSTYVLLDGPSRLDMAMARAVSAQMPLWLGYLLLLHVTAVATAWSAKRRLRVKRADRRGTALGSALLFPPQALRLRALMGQDYFPVQHPVALALAFGSTDVKREWAFQALADVRWPIHGGEDPPLAKDIVPWFGERLAARLELTLSQAQVVGESLFAAPAPAGRECVSYCPRCRDQFIAGRTHCPNGVSLRAFEVQNPP